MSRTGAVTFKGNPMTLAGQAVQVGQTAPDFTLPDADHRSVSLSALRARGPVVLSFYRGRW